MDFAVASERRVEMKESKKKKKKWGQILGFSQRYKKTEEKDCDDDSNKNWHAETFP